VNYKYRAVEKFWRNFYKLRPEQKESVRRNWQLLKANPFHPSLESHEIHELSARAKHTIYAAVIEADLRGIFRIDGSWVTSLDVGSHRMYRA
jgi:mRNA-degrading endonuclease YafQ of YafQ-DinJ toxin-antitoxin module